MEPGQLESIHHHNSDAAKLGGGRQAAGREERHQHINTPSNVTDALFRHSFKPPPHTHTHSHRQESRAPSTMLLMHFSDVPQILPPTHTHTYIYIYTCAQTHTQNKRTNTD